MKVVFEIPADYSIVVEDIIAQCGELCNSEEKENLSGDQIIAIIAIITPVVWALIDKYLSDPKITIEFQLDDNTTVTISERSVERARMKKDRIKAEWEKNNNK